MQSLCLASPPAASSSVERVTSRGGQRSTNPEWSKWSHARILFCLSLLYTLHSPATYSSAGPACVLFGLPSPSLSLLFLQFVLAHRVHEHLSSTSLPARHASHMPSLLSRFAGRFPAHTGPYSVGTVDIELPISSLPQPFATPCPDAEVTTILFRLFYPCVEPDTSAKTPAATWIPSPQDGHIREFGKFLGLSESLANLFV